MRGQAGLPKAPLCPRGPGEPELGADGRTLGKGCGWGVAGRPGGDPDTNPPLMPRSTQGWSEW